MEVYYCSTFRSSASCHSGLTTSSTRVPRLKHRIQLSAALRQEMVVGSALSAFVLTKISMQLKEGALRVEGSGKAHSQRPWRHGMTDA